MMSDGSSRMTSLDHPPSEAEIADWIGPDAYPYWCRTREWIEQNYPDVFAPEWLFGGKKHGWSLRYKKTKSFCTLIPENNRFALLIVFGEKERAKMEGIKSSLSSHTVQEYENAVTYHDGKWLLLTIASETVLKEIFLLLSLKRKPRIQPA